MTTEIAYSKSGYVRVMQTGESRFEVQTFRIIGEHKTRRANGWHKVCGIFDREKAIKFLEVYAS